MTGKSGGMGGGGSMGGGGGGGMNPMQGWGMLLGALSGIKQHYLVDKPRYDARLKYETETQRWSPWTGQQGQFVPKPYLVETMHQGAVGGGEFGRGFDRGGSEEEERPAPSEPQQGGFSSFGPVSDNNAYGGMLYGQRARRGGSSSGFGPVSSGSSYGGMLNGYYGR